MVFDSCVLIVPPLLEGVLVAYALIGISKISAVHENLLIKEKMVRYHMFFFSLYTISVLIKPWANLEKDNAI